MTDPLAQALNELSRFAETTDSNTAMVAEIKKVQSMHESQISAWVAAEAARRDAESALATVCALLKINPGELVP